MTRHSQQVERLMLGKLTEQLPTLLLMSCVTQDTNSFLPLVPFVLLITVILTMPNALTAMRISLSVTLASLLKES